MRSYLVDTNVLLRIEDKNSSHHPIAEQCIKTILQNGDDLFITSQNLIEFWAVATRPVSVNGLGLDCAGARKRLTEMQNMFQLIPDNDGILKEWLSLLDKFVIQGKRAHDARLVAVFLTSGLDHFLTFNVEDFRNFGISVLHPSVIPTSRS